MLLLLEIVLVVKLATTSAISWPFIRDAYTGILNANEISRDRTLNRLPGFYVRTYFPYISRPEHVFPRNVVPTIWILDVISWLSFIRIALKSIRIIVATVFARIIRTRVYVYILCIVELITRNDGQLGNINCNVNDEEGDPPKLPTHTHTHTHTHTIRVFIVYTIKYVLYTVYCVRVLYMYYVQRTI